MIILSGYFKYKFSSDTMSKPTSDFDLIVGKNLGAIGVRQDQIAKVEPFVHLPGTLYPERDFAENHPCGGSFGFGLHLNGGSIAWLYGRVSYDYNEKKDHADGKEHWNFEIYGIKPSGSAIPPIISIPWHVLPKSKTLEITLTDDMGESKNYNITECPIE